MGGGSGWGGQGRCEQRNSEVFVKIQKKKNIFFLGGWGHRVDVNKELKFLCKI